MKARQGRQVKNTVMTAKCKLTREECRDPNCPVHGEPDEDGKPEGDSKDEDLTPSAHKAAPRSICGSKDWINGADEFVRDMICGRPREEHTIDAATNKVGMDHEFVPLAALPEIGATNELPLHVVGVLRDAHDLIQHIQHHNEFTKGLLKRMEDILDPPKELMTMEEARVRLGLAG
jgi:hypothetical protein